MHPELLTPPQLALYSQPCRQALRYCRLQNIPFTLDKVIYRPPRDAVVTEPCVLVEEHIVTPAGIFSNIKRCAWRLVTKGHPIEALQQKACAHIFEEDTEDGFCFTSYYFMP